MNIFKKLLMRFRSASLNRKILILVLTVGVIPIGVAFTVSLGEMEKIAQEQQLYTVNQGFSQVFQAVEDKLDRVRNISTLLAVDSVISQNLKLLEQSGGVTEQLNYFNAISTYINSMETVFEPNSIVFYIDPRLALTDNQVGRFRSLSAVSETDWYVRLKANNGNATWVGFKDTLSGVSYVAVVREIWNPNNYYEAMGVLSVVFERRYLDEMLIASAEEQTIYLETADGILLASNVPEEELDRVPLGERCLNDTGFSYGKVNGKDCLTCSRMTESTNVYMVSVTSQSALEKKVAEVGKRVSLLYIVISLVSLLAVIPLTRSITKRILLLKKQIIRNSEGNIGKLEIKDDYNDEIGQLITNYNEMADKMESLLQEQYILGQMKTESDLKALQSQINPHFLYNTLDMINWMAQKDETRNIKDVVQAMSKFYRLTLSKGHDIVTIGDEIKMCDAYMEIQKRRYRGKIQYVVEAEQEINKYLIPKITLQPFLENAIVHGINEKEDARGTVILNGWLEDGRITLSVTDDGTGMKEEDKSKPHTGSHYGMGNIAQRLELFFGEKIPIQIESSPAIGTCIVINIPAKTDEESDKNGD